MSDVQDEGFFKRVVFHDNASLSSSSNGDSASVNGRHALIILNVRGISPTAVPSGGSTTLSSGASKNTTTLSVTSETGFATDDWAYIGSGSTRELVKIRSVSAGQLTLYYGTMHEHASGEAVVECYEQRLKAEVEISDDNSTFVWRSTIINTETQGDTQRTSAPRDEESEIFACGQFVAMLTDFLGPFMRVKLTMTTSGGSGSFDVECTGSFYR